MPALSAIAEGDAPLGDARVAEVVSQTLPTADYNGKKVLLIVPDGTRTAPVGLLFKTIFEQIGSATAKLDVMIALGTHQPMSEEGICGRLEISSAERTDKYRSVEFINHQWDNPDALTKVGTITAAEISELSGGLFEMDVPVEINKRIFDYDEVIIVGPVFPHEVVGFSGGNKYLFPGIAGPEILNFFHWLGAVVTNARTIGNKWTPVRKVVDRAGALVKLGKLCFAMVVRPDKSLAGLSAGSPEDAWDAAADISNGIHIVYKDKAFHSILSCAPPMYDEIWTAGKAMYKLEPVLADGGELIIYAPHVEEVCFTHRETIMAVGYHCRDYFLQQWDQFKHYPWGVLAHSTHVRGQGKFEDGIEKCRAKVTLATKIPPDVCESINLGYRDPATINIDDYKDREDEGILYIPKAGEMLYKLNDPPQWATV
ncbi:MAG: lactate racemase domain-containing protein [Limisphaerales bacterium]